MTISPVIFGILCGVFIFFMWGTVFFYRRYRIAQVNWGKTTEKLGEAIKLASELKQVVDQVLEKYPDALDQDESA